MLNRTLFKTTALVAVTMLSLVACDEMSAPTAVDHLTAHANHATPHATAVAGDMYKLARQSTSRFHSNQQALKAGYVSDPHCVAHPQLGGMGAHWVNANLVDPAFDAANPEALLYAPAKGNAKKIVGVEYIVINVGQPRPSFDGQFFDVGGVPVLTQQGIAHWSLHVWLYEANPNGLFTPFNPNVRCN
jgi:hypothetical protein